MSDRREAWWHRGRAEDVEAPPHPQEISFHRTSHQNTTFFNDDDNTIPSELSTLIAPSTLTPNYNPDLLSHPESGKGSGQSSVDGSRKAFQLAAMLGLVCIGGLFGADFVYVMVTTSHDEYSGMSSAMDMDALDLNSSVGGEESESAEYSGRDNTRTFRRRWVSKKKKTKAKKNKAGKQKKDDEMEEDGEIYNLDNDAAEEERRQGPNCAQKP